MSNIQNNPDDTAIVLTQDKQIPVFFSTEWGTVWTCQKVDLEVTNLCSFCGEAFLEGDRCWLSKEATFIICDNCVVVVKN